MPKKKLITFSHLQKKAEDFLASHKTGIQNVAKSHNNIFEVSCYILIAQYYEQLGYTLEIKNSVDGKFRFRYSTNGFPWRYSYLVACAKDNNQPAFEIWHNQKVAGAWFEGNDDKDRPLFALDIAVLNPGSLPSNLSFKDKGKGERVWAKNNDLITFGEAKNLVGYPMLIAQFLGIVHEIKPSFLHEHQEKVPDNFYFQRHLPPSLITSGNMLTGAIRVIKSFENRKIEIIVIENLSGRAFNEIISQLSLISEKYSEKLPQQGNLPDIEMLKNSEFVVKV
jgi:hypothetical protein